MKVLFDLMGAPSQSGGMRVHSEELVTTWAELFPDDELVTLGGRWTVGLTGARAVRMPEYRAVRLMVQWLISGLAARALRADWLISTSQVVSPLFPADRRVCTVHDWRHLRRPEEFGRLHRIYRAAWRRSVRNAAIAIQVSTKTLHETKALAVGGNPLMISNGRDAARRWKLDQATTVLPDQTGRLLVTFGHSRHKRPDLAIRALGKLGPGFEDVTMVVVGTSLDSAADLRNIARECGVEGRVAFPGFVTDLSYQALIRSGSVVIIASSDEGFGLPVCEANYLGIPCVVTSDSGLESVHGDRVRVADPHVDAMAAAIAEALTEPAYRTPQGEPETWEMHVRTLRGHLERRHG